MSPVFWAAILLLVGLTLVMAEIFVPSGGVIGFLSFASIVAAIVMAFYQSGPTVGVMFLSVACVAVPAVLVAAFRFLPGTPVGRRLLPSIPLAEEVLPDREQRRRLRQLVGRVGRAKSKMLPSGAVVIDGQIIDAMSEGQPIEAEQPVRVIEVRGTMVVVRPVDENATDQVAGGQSRQDDDILSRPIDTLGLDPFEDPLK
jgi:membrane-bound serine protease (ClpP class)